MQKQIYIMVTDTSSAGVEIWQYDTEEERDAEYREFCEKYWNHDNGPMPEDLDIAYQHASDSGNYVHLHEVDLPEAPACAPDKSQSEALARAAEMLRIAAAIIREHAPEATTFYDEASCDGYCVSDDCDAAAEDLEHRFSATKGANLTALPVIKDGVMDPNLRLLVRDIDE